MNKVFKGIATTGRSTTGRFHGFELHIGVNDKGELLDFIITQANVDDRTPIKENNFLKTLFGKLYADKGYISKELSELLFDQGPRLFTNVRKNMKNVLMPLRDRIMLRKRSIIEPTDDQLKNIAQIEHSRHRSFINFITNLLAGLTVYCFQEKNQVLNFKAKTHRNYRFFVNSLGRTQVNKRDTAISIVVR